MCINETIRSNEGKRKQFYVPNMQGIYDVLLLRKKESNFIIN